MFEDPRDSILADKGRVTFGAEVRDVAPSVSATENSSFEPANLHGLIMTRKLPRFLNRISWKSHVIRIPRGVTLDERADVAEVLFSHAMIAAIQKEWGLLIEMFLFWRPNRLHIVFAHVDLGVWHRVDLISFNVFGAVDQVSESLVLCVYRWVLAAADLAINLFVDLLLHRHVIVGLLFHWLGLRFGRAIEIHAYVFVISCFDALARIGVALVGCFIVIPAFFGVVVTAGDLGRPLLLQKVLGEVRLEILMLLVRDVFVYFRCLLQ